MKKTCIFLYQKTGTDSRVGLLMKNYDETK